MRSGGLVVVLVWLIFMALLVAHTLGVHIGATIEGILP